jgi:hypothetical protein
MAFLNKQTISANYCVAPVTLNMGFIYDYFYIDTSQTTSPSILNLPSAKSAFNKQYIVVDTGNNASVSTITIVAESGEFINNEPTLVINVNNGSVILETTSNNQWIAVTNFSIASEPQNWASVLNVGNLSGQNDAVLSTETATNNTRKIKPDLGTSFINFDDYSLGEFSIKLSVPATKSISLLANGNGLTVSDLYTLSSILIQANDGLYVYNGETIYTGDLTVSAGSIYQSTAASPNQIVGQLTLGNAGATTGILNFASGNPTNNSTTTFKGGERTAGNSIIYVFPTNTPSVGDVLSAGAISGGEYPLSWVANGGGGGSQNLATTLGYGYTTSGHNIEVSNLDAINFAGTGANVGMFWDAGGTFHIKETISGLDLLRLESGQLVTDLPFIATSSITSNGLISANANITLGLAGVVNGSALFYNALNANTVTLQSGITAASYSLTLPITGTNGGTQALVSNGLGTMDWQTIGSGNTLSGIHAFHRWNGNVPTSALDSPYISTVNLGVYASNYSPSWGVYDFSDLGTQFTSIVAAGKKIGLEISMGTNVPFNIFSNGCTLLTFQEFVSTNGVFRTFYQPVYWETAFQDWFDDYLDALYTYIQSDPTWVAALSHVAITGVNRATAELRVCNQVNVSGYDNSGYYQTSTDAYTIWTGVGYTSDVILDAVTLILGKVMAKFAGLPLVVPMISGNNTWLDMGDSRNLNNEIMDWLSINKGTNDIYIKDTNYNIATPVLTSEPLEYARSLGNLFLCGETANQDFNPGSPPATVLDLVDTFNIMLADGCKFAEVQTTPLVTLAAALPVYAPLFNESATGGNYLPLAGGILTGYVFQPNLPTLPYHLANKEYVDTAITTVPLTQYQIAFGDASNILTSSADFTYEGDRFNVYASNAGSTGQFRILTTSLDANYSDIATGKTGIFKIDATNTHLRFESTYVKVEEQLVTIGQLSGGNLNTFVIDDINSLSYYDNSAHTSKFGINTTTPTSTLDVVGDGNFTGYLQAVSIGGTASWIVFDDGGATVNDFGTAGSGGLINLRRGSDGNTNIYINANTGRIGIGKNGAAVALDVVGDFNITGVNTLSNLAGVGTRVVTADASGVLSTAALTSGTVTSVSVTTANGVSGSVATSTTTPAITLTLGAITPSSITIGTLGYSDTGILASFQSSTNSYNQIILQNTNNGAAASTNFNISNDLGTATTNFGEFGINSSGFTGTGALNQAGYVYLGAASQDLVLATYANKAIHFVVNSGITDAMTIAGTGLVTIPNIAASTSFIVDATDITKKVAFDLSGETAGATTTFSFIASTNKTITFPNSTGTVAILTAIQTFTNKKLTADTTTIIDGTDATKIIALSLSGMTTAKTLTLASAQTTTQTLNIPNITGTDTLATLGLTQNFTGLIGMQQTAPTSQLHINKNQNSVTQNDANGILLANSTAAISGTQSISPAIVLQGNGWKTTATAASQDVRWRMDVLPVQGAANPTSTLQFASSINGGAYSTRMNYTTGTTPTLNVFGTIITAAGGGTQNIICGNSLQCGTSTSSILGYKQTSGGGTITPRFQVANSSYITAGAISQSCDITTNSYCLLAGNGTDAIVRATMGITNLVNTLGSEAGDLAFSTQSGGTAATEKFRITSVGGLVVNSTQTATGTTGAQTINKPSGKVNFAAAATTLVVTNSLVTTSSNVFVQVNGTDVTFTSARVTLASGSFTITANAAATAETSVSFFVIN